MGARLNWLGLLAIPLLSIFCANSTAPFAPTVRCSASDVIITKAGPGTISEALICGLPMVLNAFVPCQEEGNIPFVTENNVRRQQRHLHGVCSIAA